MTPNNGPDRFAELSNQVAVLQEHINALSSGVASLEATVADHGRKLEHVEDQLERLGGRVGNIEAKLDRVVSDVSSLESSLNSIQENVTGNREQLIRVSTQIEDLGNRVQGTEQRVTLLYISTLGAFLAALALVVVNNILT
ncbi:MAG: hypothetical protein F4X65_02255 [Chloroflexi bacterium]|nr:hypothetical protein [Chloroflexota bacterium]